MKHAEIVYYTGTGNTLRALTIVARELEKNGWTVCMTDIGTGQVPAALTRTPGRAPDSGDMLIVGFPTLGFSAPASLFPYLGRLLRAGSAVAAHVAPEAAMQAESPEAGPPQTALPQVALPQAAILCACGSSATKGGRIVNGWSGTASQKVASELSRLGYQTVASADISYTENWTQVTSPQDGKIREAMTARGDAQAAAFGADLAAGRFCRLKRGLAAKAFGQPVGWIFRTLARKALARMFGADSSCTGCGLCSRICPAGGIDMKGERPAWNLNCTACNRCINACPTRSIQTTTARLVLMAGLNIFFLIASWPAAKAILRALLPALMGQLSAGAAPAFPGAGLAAFLLTFALAFALFALTTLFQVGPLDGVLRGLERNSVTARLFEASYTKKFRRYLAPGFRPGEKPYR